MLTQPGMPYFHPYVDDHEWKQIAWVCKGAHACATKIWTWRDAAVICEIWTSCSIMETYFTWRQRCEIIYRLARGQCDNVEIGCDEGLNFLDHMELIYESWVTLGGLRLGPGRRRLFFYHECQRFNSYATRQ